ncbi:MAG: ATP-binding protein [Haliscomenobacter sp.]|nr:ATP-binding protein [Haliscomenobacter sp.]
MASRCQVIAPGGIIFMEKGYSDSRGFGISAHTPEKPEVLYSGRTNTSRLEEIKKILVEVGQEENHIRRGQGYKVLYPKLQQLKLDLIGQIPTRFPWQETKTWIQDYVDALDLWIKETEGRIQNLEKEARNRLPFGENPYVPGKALTPKNGEDVFRGRKAASNQLARRITGSRELPMVLIQGQRRVGKTSLINFLETLLDRRFMVIKQDLQQGGCDTIGGWLQDLRQKVNTAFDHKEETEWIPGGNWANDWETLGNHIIKLAEAHEMRIILALDEYERLHFLLQQLPLIEAKHLLEAMRSFSQHQNRVVLLFAGLLDLVDLTEPDWSGIFVQRELIRVDYLTESDAKICFKCPSPIILFNAIRALSTGFGNLPGPAYIGTRDRLLPFDRASSRRDPIVTHSMLEECLDSTILPRGNQVMRVFWTEFVKRNATKKPWFPS